jgi:hypothetical protein
MAEGGWNMWGECENKLALFDVKQIMYNIEWQ